MLLQGTVTGHWAMLDFIKKYLESDIFSRFGEFLFVCFILEPCATWSSSLKFGILTFQSSELAPFLVRCSFMADIS